MNKKWSHDACSRHDHADIFVNIITGSMVFPDAKDRCPPLASILADAHNVIYRRIHNVTKKIKFVLHFGCCIFFEQHVELSNSLSKYIMIACFVFEDLERVN